MITERPLQKLSQSETVYPQEKAETPLTLSSRIKSAGRRKGVETRTLWKLIEHICAGTSAKCGLAAVIEFSTGCRLRKERQQTRH